MTPPLLLALAVIAGLVLLVTHDRQREEQQLAPIMLIYSNEGEPV